MPKYLQTTAARFHRFQSDLDLVIESFDSDSTTGPEYSDNTIFHPLARHCDTPFSSRNHLRTSLTPAPVCLFLMYPLACLNPPSNTPPSPPPQLNSFGGYFFSPAVLPVAGVVAEAVQFV